MHILVHSAAHLSICFCTVIRPDLQYACLPTLTIQADCGSIKGAGVLVVKGTEHYLPWWWIYDKFNHCQRRNTESRRQQLSQLFFRWSWVGGEEGHGPLAPLWIRHWHRHNSCFHENHILGSGSHKISKLGHVNFSIKCYCLQNSSAWHIQTPIDKHIENMSILVRQPKLLYTIFKQNLHRC